METEFTRYKEYTTLLTQVCKEKFLPINHKKINDGFRFNYITINGNREYSKTVIFSAGIHGDEIAGPYTVLKFLMDYKEVNPDIRIILFPVVNPYGFDRGIRFNAFRQDINRRFCDKLLAGEAKAVADTLHKIKPNYFVSLHEWSGKDGFYMYASDIINKEQIEKIPDIAASKGFKVFNDTKINNEDCKNGIIWHPNDGYKSGDERNRCTLENKVYDDGIHYICTETPSKAGLERRISVQMGIMQFVLDKLLKDK
jgi:murein peptide amidase A